MLQTENRNTSFFLLHINFKLFQIKCAKNNSSDPQGIKLLNLFALTAQNKSGRGHGKVSTQLIVLCFFSEVKRKFAL